MAARSFCYRICGASLLGLAFGYLSIAEAFAQNANCEADLAAVRMSQTTDRALRLQLEGQRDKAESERDKAEGEREKAINNLRQCEGKLSGSAHPPPPLVEGTPPSGVPKKASDDIQVEQLKADLAAALDRARDLAGKNAELARERDKFASELATLQPAIEQMKRQRMEALRAAATCKAIEITENNDGSIRVSGAVTKASDRDALRQLFLEKGVTVASMELRDLQVDGCLTLLKGGWILVREYEGNGPAKDVRISIVGSAVPSQVIPMLPRDERACTVALSSLLEHSELGQAVPFGDIDILAYKDDVLGRCRGIRNADAGLRTWVFQGGSLRGASAILVVSPQ